MKKVTFTDFRQKMKEHLDHPGQPGYISACRTRKKHFVVLTLETFNAMEETAHLLSTPANTARLMESFQETKSNINHNSGKVPLLQIKLLVNRHR